MKKKRAVLVGISGSDNGFSLSLYNLKTYAYSDSTIRHGWDIPVIQHPLITVVHESARIPPLIDQILAFEPDLVGFSCYMWNIKVFGKLAEAIREKAPNAKILWGGPEMATDYLKEGKFDDFEMDFCISGEGERTFLELLKYLEGGAPELAEISGLAYRKPGSDRLEVNQKRTPFKSLLDIPSPFLSGVVDDAVLQRPRVEANVETQRGCNLRCSYCIYHKDMSRISYASVERTLDEVRYLINKGVKNIRFVDANFTSDLDHAKAILKGLIQERFETKLMFELIPGFIDEEIAALFARFNDLYPWNEIILGVGVQTINLEILRQVRRGIKLEKFETTFALIQKYGLYAKIDLIIGLPGEDIHSIERTLEYMLEKLRSGTSHLLCCHVMRGLPGTELLEIARRHDMVFSSEREPHELIESPCLPRADMLKSLRRTGVIFRLTNHKGWADKEFISGATARDTSIRDQFFSTRDALGITNLELVDLLVEALTPYLENRGSWFARDDFPYAETWWWTYSALEISNKWILGFLADLHKKAQASNLAYEY